MEEEEEEEVVLEVKEEHILGASVDKCRWVTSGVL